MNQTQTRRPAKGSVLLATLQHIELHPDLPAKDIAMGMKVPATTMIARLKELERDGLVARQESLPGFGHFESTWRAR